ncbi:MAG: hypothetical protein Q8R55_01190 [Candidatus Taylorbacteria bacterium]|nr:hypothetical protein [Candidatus Taylorbacteria bacterium]
MVKLSSVLQLLRDEADKAHENANECIGVDNDADAYYQGLRNGYIRSAKLLEEKSESIY